MDRDVRRIIAIKQDNVEFKGNPSIHSMVDGQVAIGNVQGERLALYSKKGNRLWKTYLTSDGSNIIEKDLTIKGNADISGTLEADAYTVDGIALNEYIADTVGAMVSSNTESNITVNYQDGDNTLDFTISDSYLKNDADDTTSGVITAGGFTTTGTWTFDEFSSGTVGITTVQDSGTSFDDNDTSLMTAAAIDDRIAESSSKARAIFTGHLGEITSSTYLKTWDDMSMSSTKSYRMHRAGSVIGVSVNFHCTNLGSNALRSAAIHVYNGGSSVFSKTVHIGGTGVTGGTATQSSGTDTFSAGDKLLLYIVISHTGGAGTPPTIDDITAFFEVDFDT